MNQIYCKNKCCKLTYIDYDESITNHFTYNELSNRKAGVFVYNGARHSVLLVQSRGKLWGSPKGTVEQNENVQKCALRELKEETLIELKPHDVKECVHVRNRSVYFFYNTCMEIGRLPDNAGTLENDVTGIAWIKINCLHELVQSGVVNLNAHTRFILNFFLNCSSF